MKKSTIVAVTCLTAGIIAVPTVASAANGGAWLLGRSNSETTATTVTNSKGTPLSLNAKAGYAPLAVNSTKVVPRLNADMVDGLHASSFLRSTGKAADANKVDGLDSTAFAMRSGKTGTVVSDGSDGFGAACPAGTVFMGGGGYPYYGSVPVYSGPDWDPTTGAIIPNSWIVLDDTNIGMSFVTCYSPSGAAIPGAAVSTADLFPEAAAAATPQSKAATTKVQQFKQDR